MRGNMGANLGCPDPVVDRLGAAPGCWQVGYSHTRFQRALRQGLRVRFGCYPVGLLSECS